MAFLKRLSLYIENLNPMRENGIMLKLSNFLHTENESLLSDTLQILHNLSFDRRFREDMVDSGFLQSFRSLLQKRKFEDMVTNILYNLSRDFDLRLRFAESELLSIVMEPLITENNMSVSEELGALIINLTYNPKVAMLNLKALEMEKFVSFVLGNNSLLLYKAMKNMSYIKGAGRLLQPYVPAFVVCLLRCEPSFQVELMEILNNLACLDEPWNDFMLNTNLLNYLTTHLQVSNNEDDIILQLIIFIGQICSETSAPVLSQSGLVKNLCDVFLDRTDDIDIALQSLYAIYCFLLHDATRESFFQHFEKMVYHIVKLSQDFEKGVWTMAEFVLDAICEFEDSKGNFIKSLRFNTYNTGWEGTF
ncbi:hypothetical protein KP509_02G079300 [Ceratopteris richardii]|nr:hypothetical protein KP509_02G079300 [Ceratopteris richardii]